MPVTSCPRRSRASCDPAARAHRDLALERAPALEDGDAAHPASRRGSVQDVGQARLGPRPRPPAPGGRRRRRRAGERAVELDLLAHDLADAPHALADVVLADAGEVQAHRRAAAAVEVRRAAGDERDVARQRARQQVGRVDVVRQRRPDEQPALRPRPRRLRREVLGERLEHRVAPAPVELLERGRGSPASAPGGSTRRRRAASSTRSTGRPPACRRSSSRAPARAPRSTRGGCRARGSSRTCRGR